MAFRYIPPNVKAEKIHWMKTEIRDFNFLSNKWIGLNNITTEYRNGKPGGLGVSTALPKEVTFYKMNSDHDACWIKLKGRIKSKRIIDRAKLEQALSDLCNRIINKDIYKN